MLAEALANETNRQNSTAMTCNSSLTNGDEPNGVQPTNANLVHSCSYQQLVNEMVTLKYTISSLKSSIYSFETILKGHDIFLSLYNRSSDLNERYLREINDYKQLITNLKQKVVRLEEERTHCNWQQS